MKKLISNNYDTSQMKQRFSIKKFKFGAASVLIGLTFLGIGGQTILAEEVSGTSTETVAVASLQEMNETASVNQIGGIDPKSTSSVSGVTDIAEKPNPNVIVDSSNLSDEHSPSVPYSEGAVSSTPSESSTLSEVDSRSSSIENTATSKSSNEVTVFRTRSRRALVDNNQEISLSNAEYSDKARLVVTKQNIENYFNISGTAYGDNQGPVTLTNDISGQAGSLNLMNKINMNESFKLEGKVNIGNKYEGYTVDGRSGGDGFAAVFTTQAPGAIGLSGASIGLGGLPNSFGFKLDTWHNTSNPNINQKAGADPRFSGYQNGAFGAFYSTDSTGKAITLINDAVKLNSQPLDNIFKDIVIEYNGQTKVMVVKYDNQVFEKNIQSYLDKTRLTTKQANGQEELAFALFASTGSGTNLQQFDLTKFEYSSGGSYIKLLYVDDSTGDVLQEKLYSGTTYQSLDLSDKLTLPNYTFRRTNATTAVGYQNTNTINFKSGIQTITYTFSKVNKEQLQILVDGDSALKQTSIYTMALQIDQSAYNDSIKEGQRVLSDNTVDQTTVDNTYKYITNKINELKISAATKLVEAAEDAAQAGKDKKAEVEADGAVNPDEK
ncbi:peptidase, partial [Streptococcus uberis]